MEPVKMRPGTATKREYRRMAVGEEGEELDEAEWLHRAEAQSERRRRGQRYAFGCALFASLNAILLGYGEAKLLTRILKAMERGHLPFMMWTREL
ncbi:hypothetical protein GQ55_7G221900 [Panicum hallii var. hallii]|uniref:Uncharacterized protein n=1 Tax=Panicum hallii var. hallii TaxID=1504633 RepID=A0A2T7CXS5_9POAL|nr:hypothetical protein GQ55_7G221900 [Panicum hallii var. hallii]